MRIVLLSDRIPPENRGGAGRVAWMLAQGLRDLGHEVHVIAATPGAPFEAQRDNIPTYHLHSAYRQRFIAYRAVYNPQTIGPLCALLRRLQPDVVNAHNVHIDLSYTSLSIAHQMKMAVVFNSHDVMPFAYNRLRHFINPARCHVASPLDYRLPRFYNLCEMRFRFNPLRNLLIRRILTRHAHIRIAVSQAHQQALEANFLPPFRVVHNGLDPRAFSVSESVVNALRVRLALHGRKIILFAGRLSRDKGSIQLLRALKQLVAHLPQALLLVLSSQDFSKEGLDDAEFRPLRHQHIRMAGWLEGEDLRAAFALADVVTMPSIVFDTFGMVNLEGMAAGKPVIATCYGGAPEVVADGETGYIINPFDTAAFAGKLHHVLANPDVQDRMGAAGQARLLAHFTLKHQAQRMLTMYDEARQSV